MLTLRHRLGGLLLTMPQIMIPSCHSWNVSFGGEESTSIGFTDESGNIYIFLLSPVADMFVRCFPHIVNLACKAVLSAITNLEYAAEEAEDYIPPNTESLTFLDALSRDPVAAVRSLIRSVSFCNIM